MEDPKLLDLLDIVIDNYIFKWDPVWSKFLHSLNGVNYAPSTLRKHLNSLEKAWLVYQPYNSSGRIPTLEWFSAYLAHYLDLNTEETTDHELDIHLARNWLKYLIESLWQIVDWVVVGFLRNDEYYYLWINNLLRDDLLWEYETTRKIIRFIEDKQIVKFLDTKVIKRNQVYYSFIENKKIIISCLYAKVVIKDFDCIISIIGPTRVDYKKNISIMKKTITSLSK